jgi:hypothetical protein
VECASVQFTRHALERIFECAIPPDAVRRIIREGEEIASYPDDKPLPSPLILGFEAGRAVHVVVARNPVTGGMHCGHHLPP